MTDASDPHNRAAAQADSLFRPSPDLMCVAGLDGYFRQLDPAVERSAFLKLSWRTE